MILNIIYPGGTGCVLAPGSERHSLISELPFGCERAMQRDVWVWNGFQAEFKAGSLWLNTSTQPLIGCAALWLNLLDL